LGGPGRARRAGPWASARRGAYEIAGLARPLCRGWRWLPTAVAIGTVPFLLSFALNVSGHQVLAAVALTLVCLACAREDAWVKGVGAIATAYTAHCALVIAVASASAERVAPLLPDAPDYWQRQIAWIETGVDPEYELSAWVPAHLQLLAGVVVLAAKYPIVPLIGGVVLGVGIGYVAEQAYNLTRGPSDGGPGPDDPPDDRDRLS